MNWLIQQLVDILKGIAIGIPSFLIGLWIYTKYVAPKQAADIGVGTAEAIVEHPKIKPLIQKLKKYEQELTPLIEKAKQLDLQELIDLAKSVRVIIETQNKNLPPPPPQEEA